MARCILRACTSEIVETIPVSRRKRNGLEVACAAGHSYVVWDALVNLITNADDVEMDSFSDDTLRCINCQFPIEQGSSVPGEEGVGYYCSSDCEHEYKEKVSELPDD